MRRAIVMTLGLIGLALAHPAAADEPLVADLSKDSIEITTGFTGTDVLLFGATDGDGDVVVLVRGPDMEMVVRKKRRTAGIWINREGVTFANVPSFYRLATSGPLSETVSEAVAESYPVGVEYLDLKTISGEPADHSFRTALLRLLRTEKLYDRQIGGIQFLGSGLFRVELFFPTNVPTGTYMVDVLLLRDGALVASTRYPLAVRKIGVGAEAFRFAHDRPAAYGAIAILIALLTGWLAGLLFRKH
ncbi:MAG: TIGR02186 family protein [Proteobacteria bacterium]|nr:TIGR02186 family protein [Pseudomonadota bacterium]